MKRGEFLFYRDRLVNLGFQAFSGHTEIEYGEIISKELSPLGTFDAPSVLSSEKEFIDACKTFVVENLTDLLIREGAIRRG